jgi:cation transport regulator
MPYTDIQEIPSSVQSSLPKPAQEIYMEAFNSAWKQYAKPEDRDGVMSREEVSHRVAWSAVTDQYEKRDKHWVKKTNS